MVFSSMTFLMLFLPLTLLLYFLNDKKGWRNGVLLLASLVFYAWGEPIWIVQMLVSVAVNYICALGIERSSQKKLPKKIWLCIGVIFSMLFLLYFKYFAFFANTMADLFSLSYHIQDKTLPIGISFYTFQILTYTVDVYRGKAKAQKNPAQLLLYISCFPQLIAGPIVQYADVVDMLEKRTSTPEGFSEGARRFVIGLSKKVLLANICGAAVEMLNPADTSITLSLAGAWYTAAMYTLQIYFDFSAYSDMAIGLGMIFGFEYKENFNYPYVSGSVSEFWRRWHISLGSFFRDYVYIPLGGNRKSKGRTILNLMIVWSLTGMWHGASWNFILWGAYYGILIIFERFVIGRERLERIPALFRIPCVLVITVVGWVLFYHTDLSMAVRHMMGMVGLGISENGLTALPICDVYTLAVIRKYSVFPLIAAAACLPVVPALKKHLSSRTFWQAVSYVSATVILIISIIFLIGQSYNPFIYFRF